MEGDWWAHPGSESGTCFRANRSCRLLPAHQGVKIGVVVGWFGLVDATLPLWIRGNDELRGPLTVMEGFE